ncbi:response regulator [Actinomadura sp. HBU206391]|uniref:response regulator n=1 Tax=Actinomadura sp. HBU206391 TaxID=2731692 RepID=UPI001650258E|nr:response regulator [Actinomadura sp. HBU206391]MBC6457274.1 response regulator [Actinomadura sp. HBU206391]
MTDAVRRLRILVVEDDPGDQMLIGEAFAEHGADHEVTMVADGAEALDYVHRRGSHTAATRPDLILLDLNLPKYDGRAVLAQIKADESLCTIPVVIFTTSSRAEDISGAYELHANAYVTKPVDFDHFTSVVKVINDFFTSAARLPGPPAAA